MMAPMAYTADVPEFQSRIEYLQGAKHRQQTQAAAAAAAAAGHKQTARVVAWVCVMLHRWRGMPAGGNIGRRLLAALHAQGPVAALDIAQVPEQVCGTNINNQAGTARQLVVRCREQ